MKNKNNINGFTLIEVMVAITLFLIVLANAYKIFDIQQKSYLAQREIASMQQNLRASMYLLGRDMKMANCYLGDQGTMYHSNEHFDDSDWGHIRGITSWNNYDGKGSDAIDIAYASFIVQTKLEENMPEQSSVLKVHQDSMPNNSGSCDLTNSQGNPQQCFEPDDLVVVSDGIKSNLLQLTGVKSGGDLHLEHSPNTAHPFNCPAQKNWTHGGYAINSRVFKIKYISYRIMKKDPAHPSLSYCSDVMPDTEPGAGRTYQPVAENIEDLQIRYMLEDGTETDDFDGEENEADYNFSKVKSVRISMVARSDRQFPYYKGHRPGLEDNPGGKEDHYMRRVYTAEIELRNINIIK